jgi:hypothetical protein
MEEEGETLRGRRQTAIFLPERLVVRIQAERSEEK